jgi:hypothetical protein
MRLCLGGQGRPAASLAGTAIDPDAGEAELPARTNVVMLALRYVENRRAVDAQSCQASSDSLKMRSRGLAGSDIFGGHDQIERHLETL